MFEEISKEVGDNLIPGDSSLYRMSSVTGRVCFVSRSDSSMRVFVECPVPDGGFKDAFTSMEIYTNTIVVSDGMHSGIELWCDSDTFDSFITVASDLILFVQHNGDMPDFQRWTDSWKNILGDRKARMLVYDTLAELMVYCLELERGNGALWRGPDKGRHDILCNGYDCEVKSTTDLTGALTVHISSHLQLFAGNNPLYLYVLRMEHSENGDFCLADIVRAATERGASSEELTEKLGRYRLDTTQNMSKRFNIVAPVRRYLVDEDFPHIEDRDFRGGKIPDRIEGLTYSIIVEDLPCDIIPVRPTDDERILEFGN